MTITDSGLDELIKAFDRVGEHSRDICKASMYDAAGKIADTLKANIQALPVQDHIVRGEKRSGVTSQQRDDLANAVGIAKFRESEGYIETSIGVTGNGSHATEKYPSGVPNRLLLRSVESGTSFRQKNPVVRRTVNQVKNEAAKIIEEQITGKIKKEL